LDGETLVSELAPLDQTYNKLIQLHLTLIDWPLNNPNKKILKGPAILLHGLKKVSDSIQQLKLTNFHISSLVGKASDPKSNMDELYIHDVGKNLQETY
jgi:hypothetical protein